MTDKEDGGPAFPGDFPVYGSIGQLMDHLNNEGMSLRDYFAAKVMQTIYAGNGARMVADRDKRYDETNWDEVVALNAYEMADAMLEARKK